MVVISDITLKKSDRRSMWYPFWIEWYHLGIKWKKKGTNFTLSAWKWSQRIKQYLQKVKAQPSKYHPSCVYPLVCIIIQCQHFSHVFIFSCKKNNDLYVSIYTNTPVLFLCPQIEWSGAYCFCPFCLFVCLSVVNFNLRSYNFWTIRDRDFIFGIETSYLACILH